MRIKYILLLLLVYCTACTNNLEVENDPLLSEGGQIVLDFASGSLTRSTKTDPESAIDHLDLFVFYADGENADKLAYYGRYAADGTNNHLILSKTLFKAQTNYKAYIVANINTTQYSEDYLEKNVEDLDDLKALIQADKHVQRTDLRYKDVTPTDDTPPAYFLMDGIVTNKSNATTFVLNDGDLTQNIELKTMLYHAAAKISVTFKSSDKIQFILSASTANPNDDEEFPEPTKVYNNYNIINMRWDTKLLSEAEWSTTDKLRNTTFSPALDQKTEEDGSTTLSLDTYVYSNDWSTGADVAMRETYLLIRIPVWYNDDAAGWVAKEDNYYKVPIYTLDIDGTTKLNKINRNTHYQIEFTINRPGAQNPSEPVELVGRYAVEPWNSETINVGNESTSISYLEVNKTRDIIRYEEDDHSIEFASSSPVKAKVTSVYYIDKNGDTKTISDWTGEGYNVSVTPSGDMNGTLNIHSDIPTNNLIRYIKVEIWNDEISVEDAKVILIEQYPLEYIQGIQGYYSYRDDFHGTNSNVSTYEKGYSPYYTSARSYTAGTNGNEGTWTFNQGNDWKTFTFKAKVAIKNDDGSISLYSYYYDNQGKRGTEAVSTTDNLNNSRMYHVQITSTSNEYVLGIPRLDANGVVEDTEENGKMVSPSFMIASQLGAASSTAHKSVAMAASHCKHYVETYQENGETKEFNNWRLPTRSEIAIIMKYQSTSTEAMNEVLTGTAYWSPEGPIYTKAGGTGSSSYKIGDIVPASQWSDGWSIRCVRDAY